MKKTLVFRSRYTLSDSELERQEVDRLGCQQFLVIIKKAFYYSTVRQFRECLAESG